MGVMALKWDFDGADCGIVVGGNQAFVDRWPQNPEGEDLVLLFSIDCRRLKEFSGLQNIPEEGFISVFSTYNPPEYFLDNICYTGDDLEYRLITSGYTFVSYQKDARLCDCPVASFIPKTPVGLERKQIEKGAFPTFSFFSDDVPNGLLGVHGLYEDYDFVCQLYSSDFPAPYKDIFYLTDAIGYLFIRKNVTVKTDEEMLPGLFFVQTA